MLIKIGYWEKEKSIYKCDKCGKELSLDTRYQILINNPSSYKSQKYADLCERCLNEFKKGFNNE